MPATDTTVPDTAISSLHLFGSASEQSAGASQSQSISLADAPITKLELVLMGVLFSDSKEEARAIIADRQQRIEQHYSIGQEIAPGAELVEIYREKVILRNRGKLETLFLDEQTPERSTTRAAVEGTTPVADQLPKRSIDRTGRADLSKSLGEMRNTMLSDPAALGQQIQATPVTEEGVFRGFRLTPGQDRSMLARFGLRTGDIVTNVNGVELDNPMKGMEIFSRLASATQLDVTVLRRGQLITYSFGIE
jgi:general secretion pathway protein C